MIRWTKEGKVDRNGITNLYMLNHFNSIADALDIAVAALRRLNDGRDEYSLIADDALHQIGAEHD